MQSTSIKSSGANRKCDGSTTVICVSYQLRRFYSFFTDRCICKVLRYICGVDGMKIECTVLQMYCVVRYSLITSTYIPFLMHFSERVTNTTLICCIIEGWRRRLNQRVTALKIWVRSPILLYFFFLVGFSIASIQPLVTKIIILYFLVRGSIGNAELTLSYIKCGNKFRGGKRNLFYVAEKNWNVFALILGRVIRSKVWIFVKNPRTEFDITKKNTFVCRIFVYSLRWREIPRTHHQWKRGENNVLCSPHKKCPLLSPDRNPTYDILKNMS